MPAKSQAQREYLNAHFGHAWVKAHGFDNRGKLPARVGKKMKHPGFRKVAAGIASKEGVSQASANAILASSSRKASASAKKKNPALKKVKGACKTCGSNHGPTTGGMHGY